MSLTVHIDLSAPFCVNPRKLSLIWGYIKILFDLLLLPFPGVSVVLFIIILLFDFESFHRYFAVGLVVYSIMAISVLADIAFHILLVFGVHKKRVNHIKTFCTYTKALWMVTPILFSFYITLSLTQLALIFDLGRYHFRERLTDFIYIMPVAIIFQTFIMLAVISEIKNQENNNGISGNTKIFSSTIKLGIKSCSTEKLIENTKSEVETNKSEGETNKSEVETNDSEVETIYNEKEKLTV